ncbi:Outer membrane protein C precursor [Halomonas citrativorans]|uniref:Outer membrane protein C n=1 Tax=Halomonas citrativorans TaxID=2742612 RepID=A0A1R4HR15_9GAMM|nr:porin [Halomonas citrativorans]SJN09814.1 Outer membrane protein C precursor [Halomonas citrativorans]
MKKTLLATAIIGALSATAAAQAATVYDQDGTKLDIYGRIGLGVEGGGAQYNNDGERINRSAEFVNVGSRLGLRMSQAITSDMTAFGRLEWRFKANSREDADSGFDELRQSYLGIQSQQYGTFQAGNFDSFYLQFVSQPFDVYINNGLHFAGNGKQSRGDSIGYYTPELSGFTAFLQLKNYSERGLREVGQPDGVVLDRGDGVVSEQGNVIAPQGGVRYENGPVTVGLGFVEDVRRGGGNGEMMYGLIGQYEFTDQFSARLGYENRQNNNDQGYKDSMRAKDENGYNTVGLGATYTTGPWAFTGDFYNINRDGQDSSKAWSLGGYYKVSSAMDVFVEVNDNDAKAGSGSDNSTRRQVDNLTDDAYWLTGVRYFF